MQKALLILATLLAILFSYIDIQAWKYCLATTVILLCYRKVYSFEFREILGINFQRKNFIPFLSVAGLCALVFNFYINDVLETSEVTRTSPLTFLLWFIQPLFQSFNEEIFFRAQYFHRIKKYIKNQTLQSLIFALVFSLGHGIFFKLALGIDLDFNVYFSLFVATIIMNDLFFKFKNISICWAIHFGINFSFFGGKYFLDDVKFNDAQIFNLIIGDDKILFPSIIILTIFLVYKGLSRK